MAIFGACASPVTLNGIVGDACDHHPALVDDHRVRDAYGLCLVLVLCFGHGLGFDLGPYFCFFSSAHVVLDFCYVVFDVPSSQLWNGRPSILPGLRHSLS